MRGAGVLLVGALVAVASAGVRVELGTGVSVTVPRTPRGWHAPLRDLDADYGKLHVTAGVLPSSGSDLRKRAVQIANELAAQHDSEINWQQIQTGDGGRLEVWFNSRQEYGSCKGVVAVLKSGAVAYAVTGFWPRSNRQAEIDAHRIVKSFRKKR